MYINNHRLPSGLYTLPSNVELIVEDTAQAKLGELQRLQLPAALQAQIDAFWEPFAAANNGVDKDVLGGGVRLEGSVLTLGPTTVLKYRQIMAAKKGGVPIEPELLDRWNVVSNSHVTVTDAEDGGLDYLLDSPHVIDMTGDDRSGQHVLLTEHVSIQGLQFMSGCTGGQRERVQDITEYLDFRHNLELGLDISKSTHELSQVIVDEAMNHLIYQVRYSGTGEFFRNAIESRPPNSPVKRVMVCSLDRIQEAVSMYKRPWKWILPLNGV